MPQSQIGSGVAGIEIEVEQDRGLIRACADGGEVDGSRRRAHSALDPGKSVHLAELAALAVHPLEIEFEPAHRVAELRPLERLLEKVRAAEPHRPQQKLRAHLLVRKNDVEVGRRLSQVLERSQPLLRVRRDVE